MKYEDQDHTPKPFYDMKGLIRIQQGFLREQIKLVVHNAHLGATKPSWQMEVI